MNRTFVVGIGLLLLVLLLLFSTTYTVKYHEVAIKATFGHTDESGVIREAGLGWRLPVFIDKVTKLDTRLQVVETPLVEIATRDEIQLVVRAFLLWRVDVEGRGPLDFYEQYKTLDGAESGVRERFLTELRRSLTRYDFAELIGPESRLAAAEQSVLQALEPTLRPDGVRPVTVGISQVVLPAKASSAVLTRMGADRKDRAETVKAAGISEAEGIRSDARTKADKIRAFAEARAQAIRAQGETEAARYYEQMSASEADEELAIFLVWIDALEKALASNATLILPADLAPFHLMDPRIAGGTGVPRPGTKPAPAVASPEPAPPPPALPAVAEGSP